MKALLGTAVALALGSLMACGRSDRDRDDRDLDRDRDVQRYDGDTPTSRGGARDDWNRLHSDPVCGHTVNPKTSVSDVYNGRTFYFHSDECRDKFNDDPHAFLRDLDDDGYRTDEERKRDRRDVK